VKEMGGGKEEGEEIEKGEEGEEMEKRGGK
jgi:hypothetical protein